MIHPHGETPSSHCLNLIHVYRQTAVHALRCSVRETHYPPRGRKVGAIAPWTRSKWARSGQESVVWHSNWKQDPPLVGSRHGGSLYKFQQTGTDGVSDTPVSVPSWWKLISKFSLHSTHSRGYSNVHVMTDRNPASACFALPAFMQVLPKFPGTVTRPAVCGLACLSATNSEGQQECWSRRNRTQSRTNWPPVYKGT